MRQYLDLVEHILENGRTKGDRTGVGTRSVFGYQMRFDMQDGFPLVTTRPIPFKGIRHETVWFLSGETNIAPLVINGVGIWNEWPFQRFLEKQGSVDQYPKYSPEWYKKKVWFAECIATLPEFAKMWGDLGPIYGKQWRDFNGVDQIAKLETDLTMNPDSRRMIVSAWNPPEIPQMALPPCHSFFQVYVINGVLSLHVYMRSWDVLVGGPYNIGGYALILLMLAHVHNFTPGELVVSSGDTHLYLNHLEQAREQITREPQPLPRVEFAHKPNSILAFKAEDIRIKGYSSPYPAMKLEVAV